MHILCVGVYMFVLIDRSEGCIVKGKSKAENQGIPSII